MAINLDELSLAIGLVKGNTQALHLQDNDMIAEVESTEAFKELTEHTLGQIVADLQSYLNCLYEVKRQAEENGGEVPDGEPSISQQMRKPAPEVRNALKDVFGGFDVFG